MFLVILVDRVLFLLFIQTMAENRPYNLRSGSTDSVISPEQIQLEDETGSEQSSGAANDRQVYDISSDSSGSELDISSIFNTLDLEQST